MMKTVFKIMGATAIVAGAYLYSRKETPEQFVERAKASFEDKKQKVTDWKTAYQDFQNSMDQFKSQLPALEKSISSIQRDIDDAIFQIEPRLEEINKYSDKLK